MNGGWLNRIKIRIMKQAIVYLKKSPRLQAVLIFAFVLAVFYFAWKDRVTVERGLNGLPLFLWWERVDVTSVFMPLIVWETDITRVILESVLGLDVSQAGNVLCNTENGVCMSVVWDCTGLKQVLEFAFTILLFPACHKHKLWYIPLGVILMVLMNFLRLTVVFVAGYEGIDSMVFTHSLFKFVFNGFIFLMWLIWTEFIYRPKILAKQS